MLSELWRPLLVVGTFLAVVIVVVILLFAGGGDEPYVTPAVETPKADVAPGELDSEPAKAKNPDAETVSGQDLQVGDCLSNATSTRTRVTSFDKIDCDKPHDGEVFTIIKVPDAGKYPGKQVVSGKGERGCRARLRRQLTAKAYRDRQLGYKYVYPTVQSWAQDDREISCLATFKKSRKTKLAQRPGPAS